jgi:hypothetical protein
MEEVILLRRLRPVPPREGLFATIGVVSTRVILESFKEALVAEETASIMSFSLKLELSFDF